MTLDQERWAEALAIEQQYGEDTSRWIAERVGALAIEGDWEGVVRFREIASRLDQLLSDRFRGPQ